MNVVAPHFDTYHAGPRLSVTERNYRNITRAEQDEQVYNDLRRKFRKARRKRDYRGAEELLDMMRKMKRFMTTDIYADYPPIYDECRKMIGWLLDSADGPQLTQKNLASMVSTSHNAISGLVSRFWLGITVEYATKIHKKLTKVADEYGYHN